MAVFRPSNSNNWYVRLYLPNGKTKSFSTKQTVKRVAQQIEREEKVKLSKRLFLDEKEDISIRDAIELYSKTIRKNKSYTSTFGVRNYFESELDLASPISTVSSSLIQRLLHKKALDNVKSETLRKYVHYIRSVWKTAKLNGYSVQEVDFPTYKPSKGRVQYLSSRQEKRLLDELVPNSKRYFKQQTQNRLLVLFLLDTGCRYGEATSLRWTDLCFDQKVLNIYRSKVNNESILQLSQRLLNALVEYNKISDSDYIFTDKYGGPRKHSTIAIKKAFKRANLPPGFRVHDLRHTFASKMAQSGLTLQEIASLLGHSTTQMTERYAHLVPGEATKKAALILDQLNQPSDLPNPDPEQHSPVARPILKVV